MFSFLSQSFLIDEMPKDGIIVIDVNMQNIMCLDVNQERFVDKFPKTYAEYRRLVFEDYVPLGTVKMFEEDGYKIALIFTMMYRIGQAKSTRQQVETWTEKAILSLTKECGKEARYYSGVLNRHTQTFFPLMGRLLKDYKWVIYRN